ncbi:hypothetical protein V8F33_007999 [Rhypophila sp. PSN 637]
MKFSTSTLLALIGSITLSEASPVMAERNATALIPVFTEEITINGKVTGKIDIFDDTSLPMMGSPESSQLNKRCGSNRVTCDWNWNRAKSEFCGVLMDFLGGDSQRSISQTTSACYTDASPGNNKCCIAWPERVSGHRIWMLFNGANDAFRHCDRDGRISAVTDDVDFGGWCTRQCISNREIC